MNAVAIEATTTAVTNSRVSNFKWLIKRELWEHRAGLLITPLVVGVIILVGVIYGLIHTDAAHIQINTTGVDMHLDSDSMKGTIPFWYLFASIPFGAAFFFTTSYYALDTLCADRRDRSLLFWKSLPVSDVESVMSKLVVALFVAPGIAIGVSIATQLIVTSIFSVILSIHGWGFLTIWKLIPPVQNVLLVIYAMLITALWYVPIWSWFLLVSSWARRAAFLWATIPVGAVMLLEYLTFKTNYAVQYLGVRLVGMIPLSLHMPKDLEHLENSKRVAAVLSTPLSDMITPGAFFSNPQLWVGLIAAAVLLTATVWMRRFREAT
jgi:ABC-2 type transport system permease protein